jgi:hypothetical protein
MIVFSEFPRAAEMNSILYDRVYENILNLKGIRHRVSISGRRTEWNLHEQKIEEIDVLISWVQSILPDVSKNFAGKTEETRYRNYNEGGEPDYGYNLNSFEIAECWGVTYNKGEMLLEHNHFPYAISFIYYIRTPEGTAPITIENETCEVKEGQCIFWLASNYHSVSVNDCDGRCAIVGNILYRF